MLSLAERVIWKPEELGMLAVQVVNGDRYRSKTGNGMERKAM